MMNWLNKENVRAAAKEARLQLQKLGAEFIVFALGLMLLAAGAWQLGGMAAGLITGGAILLGDVIFGRVVAFKLASKSKGADE